MLRKTYNISLTCDRCGVHTQRTHMVPEYRPTGWREVTGRELRRRSEPLHFCPKCSRELFGWDGIVWKHEEKKVKVDLTKEFGGEVAYSTLCGVTVGDALDDLDEMTTAPENKTVADYDDEDDYIGLTD